MPTSSSASAVSVGVGSPVLVRWLSVREVVKPSAPASIASRGERGHRGDVVGRGGLAVGAALAHHVEAQRAVGHLSGDVDVERPAVERVEELGERLPVPREALVQDDAGDVLDALHQLDEALVVGGAHRREADAAVADHHGGDAVPRRRDHALVPRGLAVVVGVDVDEAGRDEQAVGVDRARRPLPSTRPTSVTTPSSMATSAVRGRRAGAVDDGAAADDQVVLAHASSLRSRSVGEQLVGEQLRPTVRACVAVGAEARAGDDEPVEPEVGELAQPLDAHVGRADDREAVDELGRRARSVCAARVAQVLVAVVAAADLGDDLAVGLGQAGAGRAGHRREVGERGDRRR